MNAVRVERHIIKAKHPYFDLLELYMHRSKNIFNSSLYSWRQIYIANDKAFKKYGDKSHNIKEPNYNELNNWLKNSDYVTDTGKNDYYSMPTVQCSQQIIKMVTKIIKAFKASLFDYYKNLSKYTGRPKLPKYKVKNGYYSLVFTNQNCKVVKSDNKQIIKFPKTMQGLEIITKLKETDKLQQVRFHRPRKGVIICEVVYKTKIKVPKVDNKKYLSVDLGIDNLVAITSNADNFQSILVNGKSLKSINRYYNDKIYNLQSMNMVLHKVKMSDRMSKLYEKRHNKIEDFMHKVSRYIINLAVEYDISKIVIGYNKDWKRNTSRSDLGRTNERFQKIPYTSLINKLEYKAENEGIEVIMTEESYTSGTSFLDNELPIKENYNKSRRKYRGLFKSDKGLINADINASYQILKKVFSDVYNCMPANNGFVFNPVKVNVY